MATRDEDVAHQILAYLVQHPDASDTVEGVAHWWLLEQRVQESLAEVQKALDQLRVQGFVIVEQAGQSHSLYRINPEKAEEIRRDLEQDK